MADGTTAVLLLSCDDQKGLVAAVSDFLYRHNGNIVHADQHTDLEEGVFLQRVEWELAGFALERDARYVVITALVLGLLLLSFGLGTAER